MEEKGKKRHYYLPRVGEQGVKDTEELEKHLAGRFLRVKDLLLSFIELHVTNNNRQ